MNTRGCLIPALLGVILFGSPAWSQPDDDAAAADDESAAADEAALPLIERLPFDRIMVRGKDGNPTAIHIEPIKLPANLRSTTTLEVVVLFPETKRPEREIEWGLILEYKPFAQLVLDESRQLIEEQKFDLAWRNLVWLTQRHPKLRGLAEARHQYLFSESVRLYQDKKFAAALAVLEELHSLDPDYETGLNRSVEEIIITAFGKLLNEYLEQEEYAAARGLLTRLERNYPGRTTEADRLRQTFIVLAEAKREESLDQVKAENYFAARLAARQMLDIWPEIEGGRQLVAEIVARYPLVVVGITQPAAPEADPLTNWSARRTAPLLARNIIEFTGHGSDGEKKETAKYVSPLGEVSVTLDRRQISLRPRTTSPDGPVLTTYALAERLLALADPASTEYAPRWGRVVETVGVEEDRVAVRLRSPHAAPLALLERPVAPRPMGLEAARQGDGLYILDSPQAGYDVQFKPNPRYAVSAGRQDVREVYYADVDQAVRALRRGEVDLLDRVSPADAERLRRAPEINVGRYQLPTLHMLWPNPASPMLKSRTYRRALLFALDREGMMESALKGGNSSPGCRVISGPLPAGFRPSDSWAYAYDPTILPVPYDPGLAAVLAALGEREVAQMAEQAGTKPPPKRPLVIAYPRGPIAPLVVDSIAQQLARIGVPCELRVLPPGQSDDPDRNYDLLYVEAAVWEPAVDLERLLAPRGLENCEAGPYVRLALQRVAESRSIQEARRRLNEAHMVIHQELTVLPLWQVVEHYAYRRQLILEPPDQDGPYLPLRLYDDIGEWRTTAAAAAE